MGTLDKRSLYAAIRSGSSFLRALYALSQRERSLAKSSVISAAWSAIAVWDITAADSTPVLFREVFDVVSKGVRSPAGRRVEGFGVDGRAGGTVIVDGPACSEGRRTVSSRGYWYENKRASSMAKPCIEFVDETAPYFGEPSCAFDFAESFLPRPMTRLNRSVKDKSSLMAFANTFDNEQICFPRDERLCGDRRPKQ